MTGNIVPGADDQQSIGTTLKKWAQGFFYTVYSQVLALNGITTAQRLALAPQNGTIVYDSTLNMLYQYTSGTWSVIGGGSGSGNVVGPASATAGDIATYADATGKLISDPGIVAASLVVGPASATDGHLAVFSGATGKLVKDGGVPGGGGNVTGPGSSTDGDIVLFNGATGQIIKDSGVGSAALTNARTPTAHESTHITGGSDIIPVATASATGHCPVLANTGTKFLRDDGTWVTPSGSGNVTGAASSTTGDIVTFADATGKVLSDSGVIAANVATTSAASPVSGDIVTYTGTGKAIQDSGTLLTSLAPKASPTFTGTVTIPSANNSLVLSGTPPANGVLLIGDGTGFSPAMLTAGSNVTITNGAGTITIAASGSGGAAFWTALGTPTYTSTSTFTLVGNQTAILPAQTPLSYTVNSVVYYGVVTASSYSAVTTVTIAGPPLSALLTAASYGDSSRFREIPPFMFQGYPEASAYTSYPYMLQSFYGAPYGFKWTLGPAYIVYFDISNRVADTGTTPKVNIMAGTAGSLTAVSTANSNAGLSLSGSNLGAVNSGITINPSNYAITNGQFLEVALTQGTNTTPMQDMMISVVVVFP